MAPLVLKPRTRKLAPLKELKAKRSQVDRTLGRKTETIDVAAFGSSV